jgi:hypothetical protein
VQRIAFLAEVVYAGFVVVSLAVFLLVGIMSHVINQTANRSSRLCNLTST